jgi:hypothetical protein
VNFFKRKNAPSMAPLSTRVLAGVKSFDDSVSSASLEIPASVGTGWSQFEKLFFQRGCLRSFWSLSS